MERTDDATLDHIDPHSARWLDFVKAHRPTLFQSSDWADVIAATYGFPMRVAALVRGGRLVAGLPYAEVDDFRGRRRVAFAFADVCEPMGDGWPALEHALCQEAVPWQIRSRVAPGPLAESREVGVHQSISLAGGAEVVRSRLHPKQRANALAGERAGLTHRLLHADEAVETFYALHSRVRVAKHRLLPQPRAFFERLAERFFPDRGFVVAAQAAGRTVAAMLFIRWGDTLYYKFSASDLDALDMHPNHYLLGNVVEEAAREGFAAVDLGISEDEGLVRFKRRLGADAAPVYSGKYLQPEKSDAVRSMEAALSDLTRILTEPGVPLAAAQAAGNAVYRYFA
jgi:CelD/BcsL family acetyltransferase involved in cellulose biosynthesis